LLAYHRVFIEEQEGVSDLNPNCDLLHQLFDVFRDLPKNGVKVALKRV